MSFSVNFYSLSALKPVSLTYKHASEEKLASELYMNTNGLDYFKHKLFDNFKDAALSRKNCLVLTDVLNLNEVFENQLTDLDFGTIPGSFYIKTSGGKYFTTLNNKIYVGGTLGTKLLLTAVPNADGSFYLKYNRTYFLEFNDQYPFDLKLSQDTIVDDFFYTRKFYIDYKNGKASFKVLTNQGYRFVSFGVDRIVRAVGLQLNDTVVNQYVLELEIITSSQLKYDFEPRAKRIQYFNETTSTVGRKTLDIKNSYVEDTNVLVSCPTTQINLSSSEASINLAVLKTNFSSSGTYNT